MPDHDSQHLHLHHHLDERVLDFLDSCFQAFNRQLNHKLEKIMATLDDIVSKVTDLSTVEDGVVTLLGDIKSKLDAAIASNDPAKLQALSDALDAQKQKLADAIVANTPSA